MARSSLHRYSSAFSSRTTNALHKRAHTHTSWLFWESHCSCFHILCCPNYGPVARNSWAHFECAIKRGLVCCERLRLKHTAHSGVITAINQMKILIFDELEGLVARCCLRGALAWTYAIDWLTLSFASYLKVSAEALKLQHTSRWSKVSVKCWRKGFPSERLHGSEKLQQKRN